MVCLSIAFAAALGAAFREIILRRRIRCARQTADGTFLLALSGLFSVVAAADGRVTDDEIAAAAKIFSEMGLSDAERAMCIGNFILVKKGKMAPDDAATTGLTLNRDARVLLFDLLLRVANADGRLDSGEERLLGEIGAKLGLGTDAVTRFRAEGLPPLGERALDEAGVPPSLIRSVRARHSHRES